MSLGGLPNGIPLYSGIFWVSVLRITGNALYVQNGKFWIKKTSCVRFWLPLCFEWLNRFDYCDCHVCLFNISLYFRPDSLTLHWQLNSFFYCLLFFLRFSCPCLSLLFRCMFHFSFSFATWSKELLIDRLSDFRAIRTGGGDKKINYQCSDAVEVASFLWII